MKLVVHYPYLSYETFAEGDNPLPKTKIYECPDEESDRQALAEALLEEADRQGWSADFHHFGETPQKPREPSVLITELGSAEAQKKLQRYQEELTAYEEACAHAPNFEAFFAGEYDGLTVEDLEGFLESYQKKADSGYPPLIYVTEGLSSLPAGPPPAAPAPAAVAPNHQSFMYSLHDNASGDERAEQIQAQLTGHLAAMDEEEFGQLIGRPFYEVTLSCSIDPATGEVTILGVL